MKADTKKLALLFIAITILVVLLRKYLRGKQVVPNLSGFGFDANQLQSVDLITKEWNRVGDGDKRKLAYILATTMVESRMGRYMYELGERSYFDKYEGRTDLGNTRKGDGYKYRGRGLVQITGRNNYRKFSNLMGIDLIGNPDLAANKNIAVKILVKGMMEGLFTRKKLGDYFNQNNADSCGARRIVNGDGCTKAKNYYNQFYKLIK